MFNFEDINTSEYQRHTQFVDINTNKPKRLSELDKNHFPYFFIDKPLPKQIFFKEQLISPDECAYLSWLAETNNKWTKISNSFWDDRTSDLFLDVSKHQYQSEYTIRIILGVHQKMKEFVEKSFGIDLRKCSCAKWESLVEEVKKCVLICANCHRERHNPDLIL